MTNTVPSRPTSTAVTAAQGMLFGGAAQSRIVWNGFGRSLSGLTDVVWELIATDPAATIRSAARFQCRMIPPPSNRLKIQSGMDQVFRPPETPPEILIRAKREDLPP